MKPRYVLSATTLAVALCGAAVVRPAFAHCDGPDGDMRASFEAVVSSAFAQADADANGKLTAEEFANFHDILRRQMEAAHFQALDKDGDGAVSLDELKADHHGGPPFGPGL
ncbi:MAG TPA: hypothetical protein VGK20_17865 [Candidatus Binatia bacterium]|jgi:hypothetical protein